MMARQPRQLQPDSIYHVTARGNRQQQIFYDDGDRRFYLRQFEKVQHESHVEGVAYTLMTNHVHLIVHDAQCELSDAIHDLHGLFAKHINEQRDISGHLFQGRFYAKRIETEEQLLQTVRYTHINPVAAGLVSQSDQYPWSSYKLYLQRQAPTIINRTRVLGCFGEDQVRAQEAFRDFMGDRCCSDAQKIAAVLVDYQGGIIAHACIAIRQICGILCQKDVCRTALMQMLYRYGCFTLQEIATSLGVSISTVQRVVKR